LAFEPVDEHRIAVFQALRERFGEAERLAKQEYRQEVRELLAIGELTIWQLFAGKPGKFSFYRPFEKVEKKVRGENVVQIFRPGVIAGESDGQQITFAVGLGGVERIVEEVHAAGLSLAVKALNDPEFWTKKDELKPLIPIHRTLWSIRRIAEVQGQGPAAESELKKIGKGEGLVSPEKFFSSKESGETLVIFDEKDGGDKPKPWRNWDKDGVMRDGDRRYNPVYNFAAILCRDLDGKVFWKKAPAHLESVFKEALNKPLETVQGQKAVFGAPFALYSWAKRKYGSDGSADQKPKTDPEPMPQKKGKGKASK
jgi:hypothetical protein